MNNKKSIVITAIVTVFLTSAFYMTPVGENIYLIIKTLSGDMSFSAKMDRMSQLVDKYYINEYDSKKMEDAALSAYAAEINDPYTMYINKDNYTAMLESMGGDYVGIGVEVYINDDFITIMSVFENSPAKKAGILKGDKIIAVEGEKADSSNYQESINKIKGIDAPEGDNDIIITILRGEETIDFTLIREAVSVDTVFSKVIAPSIGYIRLTDFGEKTYADFAVQYTQLKNQNITGLIIDLRNNPGGMLTTVVNIADAILPSGNILTIKDKQGNETPYDSGESSIDLPLCVLINENSASASEVLAGAVRDLKKGTLIGTKSYGKGVVQSLMEFGDGSAFKLTTAKYYTPSGECIDGHGITPDIEVTLPEELLNKSIDELTLEEDEQLRTAVQVLN
ncbi:MAG: S41 family peptidase [Clostridia bacterium]|nr:S41 family peptidase [Clostridia bacterium]